VQEEIRRVGAWYRFTIEAKSKEIEERVELLRTDRFFRGHLALLRWNLREISDRYRRLPQRYKGSEQPSSQISISLAPEPKHMI